MYANKFLIANPVVTDPFFSNSVICLLKHSPKGAMGICLNNSLSVGTVEFSEISKLLKSYEGYEDFGDFKKSIPLYAGGPCRTSGIYFIHGYEEFSDFFLPDVESEKSEFDLGLPTSFENDLKQEEIIKKLKVIDGVYFGSPFNFAHIVKSGKINENKFRFYAGISNWGPGQIEREIAGGAWTIQDVNPEIFFDIKALDILAGKVEKVEKKGWDRFNFSLN